MRYQLLTAAQKRAYLADDSRCPYCQSTRIDCRRSPLAEFTFIHLCRVCWREWLAVYKLVEVEDNDLLCELCGRFLRAGEEVMRNPNLVDGPLVHQRCVIEKNTMGLSPVDVFEGRKHGQLED